MCTITHKNIWPVILTLILITSAPTFAGKIIYVDDNTTGANNGSSWADAYNYLQDALAAAWSGDEIRVAQGIYTPDSNSADPNGSGDREATFQLINGVTLKGGYAGFGAPEPNARDIQLYETILSGDLNGDDGPDFAYNAENSYHVVTGSGTDETSVLDGFTIIGGNANASYPNSRGGGMLILGGDGPIVRNCKFTNNCACLGGGMFNNAFTSIENCEFISNITISISTSSLKRGGGMFNHVNSSPIVRNCRFISNSATQGCGMYNNQATPIVEDCEFISNIAIESVGHISKGGGIFSGGSVYGPDCYTIVKNCSFINNEATLGGGMYSVARNHPKLTNCTFEGNSATNDGGGMYNYDYRCKPVLTDCIFSGNTASNNGGALYNCDGPVSNCIISINSAGNDGGGLYGCMGPIVNCTIIGNKAEFGGGAARCGLISNCTFSKNRANGDGGGIYCYGNDTTVVNCIMWGDTAPQGDEIALFGYWMFHFMEWFFYPSSITVSYSDVQGGDARVYIDSGCTLNWETRSIDADPCFVVVGYWEPNENPADPNDDFWVEGDYHLLPGSPCIDAGDPNYVSEPNETDLDGRPRIIGGRIDMGAYEYSPPILAEVRITPRTVSLASSGKWITAFLRLPEGYNVTDIDPNSILLESEIKPDKFWLSEDNQTATAKFDREQVRNILSVGQIELTINGRLTDGTSFEGIDIIKVTDKAGKKSAK